MATPVSLPILTARLRHVSGDAVITPLLHPDISWINTDVGELAAAFERAVQRGIVDGGTYSGVLPLAPELKLRYRKIKFSIPKAPDKHLYPPQEIELDAYLAPLSRGGWLGFLPAIGVEATGRKREELEKRLIAAARLEFARKLRLTDVRGLLTARWYNGIEPVENTIRLQFHSLTELKNLWAHKLKPLLPAATTEMKPMEKRVFRMEEPIDRVFRALRGKYTRSVLLVGPSGVGKSAIVEEFLRTKDRHAELRGKKVRETTAARLIQKLTQEVGWEQNLARVCTELRESGDLLYVRNLAELFEVGQYAGNNVSMAEYLRPFLERGDVTLITECTDEELTRLEIRSPGYPSLFHEVRITEPPPDELEEIILHRIRKVEPEAIRESLRLQKRFTPYSGFPGKTVRFLESLQLAREDAERPMARPEVLRQFCEETGMPDFMVDPDIPLPVEEMDRQFRTSVFGQDEAVDTVVDLLTSVKTGLTRSGKPIASLLFTGPTGVGKTELAKVLAEFMFGGRAKMIRFDMSEYADALSVLRLTGEAGGGDGLLTGRVRQEPFSVVLFDELEKAHPVFFDFLLQILGEGRLTDARGSVADFCSTIIIMTSNLGASELPAGELGFGKADGQRDRIRDHFRTAVESYFRPELFNRLDRVVAFAPLERETIRRIVDREMKKVRARPGIAYRNVNLSVNDETLDHLGEQGYDGVYGARQLQRTMRSEFIIPLARQLNRYETSLPVEATVKMKAGKVTPLVRGLSGIAAVDQEIGETGVTLRQAVDHVSFQRRALQQVEDGACYSRLRSELEILERKRRKQKKFWKNPDNARNHQLYSRLKKAFDGHRREGEWLEAEAVLTLLDPERIAAIDLHELSQDHRSSTAKTLVEIFHAIYPGYGRCMLGIYGESGLVDDLANMYGDFVNAMGWECTARDVWILLPQEKYKSRPRGAAAPTTESRRVGVELEITGPACFLFFEQEGGYHTWSDAKNRKQIVYIRPTMEKQASFAATRPQGLHRNSFYPKNLSRRICLHGGIEDKTYKLKKSGDPEKLLFAHLKDLYGINLFGKLKA